MENKVYVELENIKKAYKSATEFSFKVLYNLLNNEHYAAAKDVIGIIENSLDVDVFVSGLTPVVFAVEEQTVEPIQGVTTPDVGA